MVIRYKKSIFKIYYGVVEMLIVVQRHRHGTLQCLVTIVSLHFVLVLGV